MYKIPIFVDFDGTLFDTALMRDAIYDAFLKSGYDHEDIHSTYIAECLDYKYSPEGQFQRLQRIKHANERLTSARIDNLYKLVEKYVYPDSRDFLSKINRSKYEADVLTMGDLKFQKRKVEVSGLSDVIDNTYICDIQKWDYLKNVVMHRDYFIIIDDRSDTLENVKNRYPKALCIQIVRNDLDIDDASKFYKEVWQGIRIHNLNQALRYLEM